MWTFPTVREACTNYEVVVFQPQTVIPPQLGSVATVTLKLSFLPYLFLPFVWIFLLPPPSYRLPFRIRSPPNSSLIWTRSCLSPGICWILGVLPVAGLSTPLWPRLDLLEFSSKSWHRLVLGLSLGGFSREGEMPGHLPSL